MQSECDGVESLSGFYMQECRDNLKAARAFIEFVCSILRTQGLMVQGQASKDRSRATATEVNDQKLLRLG